MAVSGEAAEKARQQAMEATGKYIVVVDGSFRPRMRRVFLHCRISNQQMLEETLRTPSRGGGRQLRGLRGIPRPIPIQLAPWRSRSSSATSR